MTRTLAAAVVFLSLLAADATGALAGPDARAEPALAAWAVDAAGLVTVDGGAAHRGDLAAVALNAPVSEITVTASGDGYWLLGADGGVFAFGDAAFHGSTGGLPLNAPVRSMATTPTGAGYWLVAADGGVFAFGDAAFHGSMGGRSLNQPIVAMAPTASGGGYWLIGADGGTFAFGDAGFHGSTGGGEPGAPVVAMTPTPSGEGYWLLDADGAVHPFGDAGGHGGVPPGGGAPLDLAPTADGAGYWIASADAVHAFGSAPPVAPDLGTGRVDVALRTAAAVPLGDDPNGLGPVDARPGPPVTIPPPPSPPEPMPVGPRFGDADTPTAEARLARRSDVLWMGTFDHDGDWWQEHGVSGTMGPQDGRGTLDGRRLDDLPAPPGGHGDALRIRFNPDGLDPRAYEARFGARYHQTTDRMGLDPDGLHDVYFRYRVYVPDDFGCDDVGGKLPGLAGNPRASEHPGSGSGGGDYHEDAWSGRLMWRSNCAVNGYFYVYRVGSHRMEDTRRADGRYVGMGPLLTLPDGSPNRLRTGEWNTFEIRYRMNTPNQVDGTIDVWMNGIHSLDVDRVQFYGPSQQRHDRGANVIRMDAFYGGPEGVARPTELWFDDIVLATRPIGLRTD